MDPGSRRFMWDLISHTMKNRSVILTTHSMEESEALCQRIGIMVGGRLRCLGSGTRIKSIYGQGYELSVNVAPGNLELQKQFKEWIKANWPDSSAVECHDNNMRYRVAKLQPQSHFAAQNPVAAEEKAHDSAVQPGFDQVSIATMFATMEQVKEQFHVREYSVSETSLEQIFIHFASQQDEETGKISGIIVN
jgi:ABC-type multidrug transport system ATPase subunit